MSQAGIIDFTNSDPQIPTSFITNNGTAIPLANELEVLGTAVAAGTTPVETTGSGNTVTIEVQRSQAIASTNAANVGLAAFNSSEFTVDGNGFVSLIGASMAVDSIGVDTSTAPGTNPVLPTVGGQININGAVVVNHSVPIETHSRAANALNVEVQYSGSNGSSNGSLSGLAHFNNSQFTVDNVGFVSLIGGSLAVDSLGVQATSGAGTDPVLPTAAGVIEIEGAVVSAGTNPIRSVSTAANTLQIQAQISQALAGADATKIGLSNFSSTDFAVAATGFVTLSTTGAAKTITGDSGGALSPTANNWNILGGPGVTTSGSGSTLTINAVVMTDQGSSTTIASDNGYFVTGAFAMTLPASPAQGEIVRIVADTSSTVTVTGNTGQIIRIGNVATAAAGSVTNTAQGDVLTLCYRASNTTWISIGGVGNWNV